MQPCNFWVMLQVPSPYPGHAVVLTCGVTNCTGVEGIISGCNKSGTGGSGLTWLLCTET